MTVVGLVLFPLDAVLLFYHLLLHSECDQIHWIDELLEGIDRVQSAENHLGLALGNLREDETRAVA